MTIQIGPITLDNPAILATMSGISDMPYRRLAKRYGAGLVISEMIASRAMIYAKWPKLTWRGTPTSKSHGRLAAACALCSASGTWCVSFGASNWRSESFFVFLAGPLPQNDYPRWRKQIISEPENLKKFLNSGMVQGAQCLF